MSDSIWLKVDLEIEYAKSLPPGTAPCAREEWSERKQHNVYVKPAVSCAWNCDHCGWNPEEKKRRLIRMGYIKEA